ncbi:transferase, chloramphenicol acetyltransferase-like domain protein [Tanacetum coccineum]
MFGLRWNCKDRKAEVFQVSNYDTTVAQRRLEDKQPEEKTNTDCLVKEQEKRVMLLKRIKESMKANLGKLLKYNAWSTRNEIEHKSIGGIHLMSIQNVKPDRPTPDALRSYKLSAFDQINAPSYVPFIFFYLNNSNGNTNINDIILERSKLLKQSMSETLTRFYPFAGKYTNDIHIDCNDEGVYYVETQVDAGLLSFLEKPDYKLIPSLLPVPPNGKEPTLGYYLVMIQVNFYSYAKGDKQNIIYPSFVSSSLFLANNTTSSYPSFPLSSLAVWPMMLKKGKCVTKRFRFDASALQTLKAKANEYVSATRVIAVTSLIWKCATSAARKLNGERLSILHIAVC